jgi:predicted TIM-barrel fold metal-dependent hydrolase
MRQFLLTLVVLLQACAANHPDQPAPAVAIRAALAEVVPPRVDHHQHLLSPDLARRFNGLPDLPTIQLPSDLRQLLIRRAAVWNDQANLARLYTANALLPLNEGPASGFLRGPAPIASFLAGRFRGGAYQLTPVRYESSGQLASISGYYTRAKRPISYFQLLLIKHRDGSWLISSETPTFRGAPFQEPIFASDLIKMLDEAGIARAVVLSGAFGFGSKNMDLVGAQETTAQRHALVRAENDWVAQQVSSFPDRLIAFCSVNPLEPYAVAELDRCAASRRFQGLKLHLDESSVDLTNLDHVAAVRAVFAQANRHRFPMVVHVGNNQTQEGAAPANRANVETLLRDIMPAAPDVVVQIAHLWGGQGFSKAALDAYADAMTRRAPGTQKLYFDIAEAPLIASQYPPSMQRKILDDVAVAIRKIGIERILYGSDGMLIGHLPPQEAWTQFRMSVPLTDKEFNQIAKNAAPYIQ